MNEFTIKDIENLSGIKAHTWRIWEQRYGIGVSRRKESNHRIYDSENLKQVLRISYLYHEGIKISKIALLDPEEIRTLAKSTLPKEYSNAFYVKELLEAAIDFDEEKFETTFQEALRRMGIEEAFLKILKTFQEKIGVLWLTDHVIPAQEHFTTNIIRQKLAVAIDSLPPVLKTEKKDIILFTPEKEHHEIPLQFIHYQLKKNMNKVIYFGSNVSLDSLEKYKQNCSFSHMLFHLVTNLTNKEPDEYLHEISSRFPDTSIIMAGSQVCSVTKIPKNVRLLKSLAETLAFTEE